jgi:hypothetical protein
VINPPRAGLDTLAKAGVRCVKEAVVVKVRVSGGGGGSSGRRRHPVIGKVYTYDTN